MCFTSVNNHGNRDHADHTRVEFSAYKAAISYHGNAAISYHGKTAVSYQGNAAISYRDNAISVTHQ